MQTPPGILDTLPDEVRDKRVVKVGVAQEVLQASRSQVYELLTSGKIRSVKIGRSRRIPIAALTEYLDSLVGN